MASAAWSNPYSLHPWFKMPSLKRKDASSDEEDAPIATPIRAASYGTRRSLSPAPSPKRRRCDVLENGMSQLTLDAQFASGHAVSLVPSVQFPDTPILSSQTTSPLWMDRQHAPDVTQLSNTVIPTAVVLPGSVEEPTSPEATLEDADVPDVSMKVPSWYEIEKDRIVITDLEDSDQEDNNDPASSNNAATASGRDHAAQFTISSALLERLPKPHRLGPLGPEAGPSNALVLYRPLAPLPAEAREEEDGSQRQTAEEAPRIEEVGQEDTDVPIACSDQEVPMELSPIVQSVGDPADEPMDIEML
ncbi:hypothetical protein C8Q78DRAFT_1066882 [Trametes maxima]|nr:hypothetical protein C8Q78DRAFT_1066882 [Trametes maxima]